MRSITEPGGARFTLAYAGEGRIEAVTDASGRVYRFERDVAGRAVAEVDFDGRRTLHACDAAGRVTETTRPDGARLGFKRDRSGLLVRLTALQPNESQPCEVITCAYDRRGLLVEATSRASHVRLTRDGDGRVVQETRDGRAVEPVAGAEEPRIEPRIGQGLVRHIRDPLGLVASLIEREQPPSVIHDALGRATGRSTLLDGLRIASSEGGAEKLASQRGAADGRWFMESNAEVLAAPRGELWAFEREASGAGERAAAGDDLIESASALQGERVTLAHDACGRLVSRTVERDGESPRVWRYEWDPLDRLVVCVTPLGERRGYSYDALGRRL